MGPLAPWTSGSSISTRARPDFTADKSKKRSSAIYVPGKPLFPYYSEIGISCVMGLIASLSGRPPGRATLTPPSKTGSSRDSTRTTITKRWLNRRTHTTQRLDNHALIGCTATIRLLTKSIGSGAAPPWIGSSTCPRIGRCPSAEEGPSAKTSRNALSPLPSLHTRTGDPVRLSVTAGCYSKTRLPRNRFVA